MVGCQNQKYSFKYKIKDDYENKIREGLAESFIDFTKDTVKIYNSGFKNWEDKERETYALQDYMYDTTDNYKTLLVGINAYEKSVLEIMEMQYRAVGDLWFLQMQKLLDKANLEIGDGKFKDEIKPQEHYEEKLEQIKKDMEKALNITKEYLR